jgi:hypothetical protein
MVRSFCAFAILLIVVPVMAQDKSAEKKDTPKKEVSPPTKKETPPVKRYQSVGTITGKLVKANGDDQTVQIEARAPGRYGRNEKQDYSLADDVKIRVLKLPDRLDDKNKPLPYTAAEKLKLKGDDPKLPGYSTELSALNTGQLVELHLSINKPAPGAKKKDKSAEAEKPFVTMIVVSGDVPKISEKDKEKKKP